MTTEQEKGQVTEPEQQATELEQALEPEQQASEAPTLEAEPEPISGEEVSSERQEVETKSVQKQLAELVKACVLESRSCEDLGTKFTEAAKELGIGFNELLDMVFEIVTRKEG